MDILKVIRQDHKDITALVKKIVAKADGPSTELRPMARELAVMVLLHAKAEERALYEMCEVHGKHDLKDFALEGRIEHKLVELVLKRLVSLEPGDDGKFKAAAKVADDLLHHHAIEEEEETVFPKLQKSFSDEERATMAKVMIGAKSKLRPRIEAMLENPETASAMPPKKPAVRGRGKGAEALPH